MSKVILLNGSANRHGCTATALEEMIGVFEAEGIETELIQIGTEDIRGCIACNKCSETGRCVFDDLVNEVAPKFEAADGLVAGSPVYYGSRFRKPDTCCPFGQIVLQHTFFKAYESGSCGSQLQKRRQYCKF